jgi:hypothetical protein
VNLDKGQQPRALRLFAGFDKGALCLGDLGCCYVAGGHPCLRRVEVIPTQKQRFCAPASFPACRDFPKSRVLANPVEVLPQGVSQFREWPRYASVGIEADELQAPELFGDVVIGNRLEDNRQEPL